MRMFLVSLLFVLSVSTVYAGDMEGQCSGGITGGGTAGPARRGGTMDGQKTGGITGQRGGITGQRSGGITGEVPCDGKPAPTPAPVQCSSEYRPPSSELVVRSEPPQKKKDGFGGFFRGIGRALIPDVTTSSSAYTYHSEETGGGVWVRKGSTGHAGSGTSWRTDASASGHTGRDEFTETHLGPHGYETTTTRTYHSGGQVDVRFRASAKSGLNDPNYAAERQKKIEDAYIPRAVREERDGHKKKGNNK